MKRRDRSPSALRGHVDEDLVQALTGTLRFRTFVLLAVSSAVIDDLREPGPWTVFAPTDEAFARLAPETLDALLRPDGIEAMVDLVENHVCRARRAGVPWVSLLGKRLSPTYNGERRKCRNGVLVTLDQVLVPQVGTLRRPSMLRLCPP